MFVSLLGSVVPVRVLEEADWASRQLTVNPISVKISLIDTPLMR